ncbi:MAG: phosphoglycerate dehydrogenase [Elusimicrobia bacterium CG1_02_37_114]|nr:MAG: phosphoglycerate dehydrogenase [Elusimicrobia bacterium CG1_02_37_114]PIV53112.1 MAG: phosphoglycerate dehydrogenase [Elusimicrobia bacterium CG02_land_8_20_14_3_00_37_13]PIZ14410.1 MAG: phosphoglycerate dehydrogenase [Elusimicrobia bacterium CG_4_10_14_0_8_um_filter_37_32]
MTKILMTYSSTEGMEKLLNNSEFKIDVHPKPSPEEYLKIVAGSDYDVLLLRSEVKVTSDIIKAGKNLKLIIRAGTGVDNIDSKTATEYGVIVMNVPGGNTISACEHTIAMMLALARNVPQASGLLKTGVWKKEKFLGTELQGKTLGVVGLGRIGREVAKRAQSFEMRIIGYDPFVSEDFAKTINIELKTLDELFAESDFITLHVPKSDSTKYMINSETIKKMKEGVRIINCARGGIIDEIALCEAIKSGYVKGAAIDVFEKEPAPPDHPLFKLDNVIVTPHLGASTEEAQVKIAQEVSDMILDFFTNNIVCNAINMPSIDRETYKKIKPYSDLLEKMGLLQAQLIEGGIKEILLQYNGEISRSNLSVLTLSYLKGLLSPILDIKVNFVNAGLLARERGIKIKEIKNEQAEDFTSLIDAKVITDSEQLNVCGTVFADQFPRIVNLRDLDVDVRPQGCMIILENADTPGIIGTVGTILGKNKINIANMQVGRRQSGGDAITIVNVDTCPSNQVIDEINKIKGVKKAKFVQL